MGSQPKRCAYYSITNAVLSHTDGLIRKRSVGKKGVFEDGQCMDSQRGEKKHILWTPFLDTE